jgi:capsular exopolysaccharide synthesis family protein
MQHPESKSGLSLEEVLGTLRRRAVHIALCVFLAGAAALGYSLKQTKQYTATASLVFNNTQLSQQVAGLQAASGGDPQAQQGTNLKLVTLGGSADKTARLVGHGLSRKKVVDAVAVSSEANTNIVQVSATSSSPTLAADIANTYSEQFVREQQNASGRYFKTALASVKAQLDDLPADQRSGPAGLALQDRAQSLEILTQIQSGNVQVAQRAPVPTAASSPKVVRNTLLGAFLGLLLGLSLAFLRERLDRRIKEPEDLERIFELPLLATVPESSAYPAHTALGEGARVLPAPEAEVFKMLRARLRYFNINRDLRLVLVTSATPGDGKTTVAQNLAEAAASAGGRVLLLEADLRRPTLAGRLGLRSAPGLAEVLISSCSVDDALQATSLEPATNGSSRQNSAVRVIVSGMVPPNPAELIESSAMERLLDWAAESFDLVLIDTPPLSVVPDAIPLMRRIHGVVIVSRLGKSTRDGAVRLRAELTRLHAPLLGVVANGFAGRGVTGYEYDSYGYVAPSGGLASEPRVAEAEPTKS